MNTEAPQLQSPAPETRAGAPASPPAKRSRKPLRRAGPMVGLVAFALSLWVLQRWLGGQRHADVAAALVALPWAAVAVCALLTASNYAVMAGYDLLAMRHLGLKLAPAQVATTAFVANALGNNFGTTLITGAAVRYWSYTVAGVAGPDIARIVVFCSASFWLGYLLASGVVFLLVPPEGLGTWRWAGLGLADVGLASLAGAALVLLAVAAANSGTLPLAWRRWRVRLPSLRITAGQFAVGALDVTLMGSAFAVLVRGHGVPMLDGLAVVLLAVAAGNVSLVPGGLGVFESVVILLLGARVPPAGLAAALLVYRLVYYIAPLVLAVLLLGLRTGAGAGPVVAAAWRERLGPSTRTLLTLAPDLLAAAVFLAGALLLLTGSLPAASGRLQALAGLMPVALIEASHFLASIAGAAMLLLAHALQRRLDAAWQLTMLLLAASAVFSMGRGWDYDQALVLAFVAALVWAARRQFRRKSSLLAEPFSPAWLAASAIVLVATGWLVAFAHRRIGPAEQPWWDFTLHAEAARSLRAAVGAATLLALASLHWLLRPARPALALPNAQELERAAAIARQSPATYANLVLRGDKAVLFATGGEAFLMYGRSGRSWVAMGDPVGSRAGARELLWRFKDLCDRFDGWCVFFEVHEERRAQYAELGLVLTPLGEQARVDLTRFSLEGSEHRDLRHARARLLRAGCRFEVVPAAGVPALLPELAAVSDAWLATKATREKGFSNASFDGAYLARFPVAVVRRGARVLAFANVWAGSGGEELSIDLMRHAADAPHGTMDFLFTELLLWGRAQGWRWFDFGMAPLAGLERREDAPMWGRLATLLYRHGEHFYNFDGLRRYKAKFHPVWTPLYLASPGGVALPAILVDVTALIAGSLPGIVSRLGGRGRHA